MDKVGVRIQPLDEPVFLRFFLFEKIKSAWQLSVTWCKGFLFAIGSAPYSMTDSLFCEICSVRGYSQVSFDQHLASGDTATVPTKDPRSKQEDASSYCALFVTTQLKHAMNSQSIEEVMSTANVCLIGGQMPPYVIWDHFMKGRNCYSYMQILQLTWKQGTSRLEAYHGCWKTWDLDLHVLHVWWKGSLLQR